MKLGSALFECSPKQTVIELSDQSLISASALIGRLINDTQLLSDIESIEVGGEANIENLYRLILAIFLGIKASIHKQEKFDILNEGQYLTKVINESLNFFKSSNQQEINLTDFAYSNFKKNFENSIKSFQIYLTTSGSSGSPKLIKLESGSINFQASEVSTRLNLNKNTRQLLYMPINYVYGLSIVTTWLQSPGCLIIPIYTIQAPNQFFNELISRKVTVFSGVPYTYNMLCKWGPEKLHNSSIKALTQAGGRLQIESKKKIISYIKNIDFWVMYGQTEFGGRISQYVISKENIDELCVGYTLPHIKIHIEKDEISSDLGEIYVHSPSIAKNLSSFEDCISLDGFDFYPTGDIGKYENELLYVSDRNKNFIKIGGSRISNAAVSKNLLKVDGIEDCFLCLGNKKNEKILIGLHTDLYKELNTQWEVSKKIDEDLGKDILLNSLDGKPYEILLLHGQLPLLENGKLWIWKIHKILKEASVEKKSIHIWL